MSAPTALSYIRIRTTRPTSSAAAAMRDRDDGVDGHAQQTEVVEGDRSEHLARDERRRWRRTGRHFTESRPTIAESGSDWRLAQSQSAQAKDRPKAVSVASLLAERDIFPQLERAKAKFIFGFRRRRRSQ